MSVKEGLVLPLARAYGMTEAEAQEMVVMYAIFSEYGEDFFEVGKARRALRTVKSLFSLVGRFKKNPKAVYSVVFVFAGKWRAAK